MKQDIESRFQILITISLFFPVLFYNLGIAIGNGPGKALSSSLMLGIVVGMVIATYIAYQVRKNSLSDDSLRHLAEWLMVGIGVFVVPIVGAGLAADSVLPSWVQALIAYTWAVGSLFVLIFPIIIELFILFGSSKAD